MKATITIQSLLDNYALYMAGGMTYTNSDRYFTSEFLCHQIAELLVPKGETVPQSFGASRPMTYGDIKNFKIGEQFREQWGEIIGRYPSGGVMEQWNDDTEYSSENFKFDPRQDERSRDWSQEYRMKVLKKAALEHPNLVFTFSDYL